MAKTDDAETLSLEVFHQLRADIVSGRFAPGSRVSPAEVRARFAVSTGVVREAMTRLEMHGLLRAEPNRGYYVPSLSVEDLEHLVEVRVLNETAALRGAIRHGDVEWESAVVAAHHRMSRLAGSGGASDRRSDARVDAHQAFHLHLLEGCGNPALMQICMRLQDAAELYRGWATEVFIRSKRDIPAEHRALMDAALARDEPLAVQLLESHLRQTASSVIEQARWDAFPQSGRPDHPPTTS